MPSSGGAAALHISLRRSGCRVVDTCRTGSTIRGSKIFTWFLDVFLVSSRIDPAQIYHLTTWMLPPSRGPVFGAGPGLCC